MTIAPEARASCAAKLKTQIWQRLLFLVDLNVHWYSTSPKNEDIVTAFERDGSEKSIISRQGRTSDDILSNKYLEMIDLRKRRPFFIWKVLWDAN